MAPPRPPPVAYRENKSLFSENFKKAGKADPAAFRVEIAETIAECLRDKFWETIGESAGRRLTSMTFDYGTYCESEEHDPLIPKDDHFLPETVYQHAPAFLRMKVMFFSSTALFSSLMLYH